MIMTLSMRKIVESRCRRGGASLHRNLLVAGVLFKARDVLLAAAAAEDSVEKSGDETTPGDASNNAKSAEDEMDCDEQTVPDVTSSSLMSSSLPADECSRMSDDKENVAPTPTADHLARCDDVSQLSTRAPVKRQSRDPVDDDVTPCKTTRAADTTVDHCSFTECGKFHFCVNYFYFEFTLNNIDFSV